MKTMSDKRLQSSSFSPRTDSNRRCFNPKQPFRLAFSLHKPFTGNFLPAIKVVDYGMKTSISHLHTFYFCVGYQIIYPLLVCFPVIDFLFYFILFFGFISLLLTFFFFDILFYISSGHHIFQNMSSYVLYVGIRQ